MVYHAETMRTHLDCVACLVRQSVDAVKVASSDDAVRKRTLQAVMAEAAKLDYALPPPEMAGRIHAVIREVSANPDPYLEVKQRCNRIALTHLDRLRSRVAAADDPLIAAMRIAMAGNVMDFGVLEAGDDLGLDQAIASASSEAPAIDHSEALRTAIAAAESILYLVDNAGEIVFDILLLERLPRGRVTIAAKAGPVLNDATVAEVIDVGLADFGEVVSTGSRFPGTILPSCSPEFRERFAAADLIIAKGQANYETVHGVRANLFNLLRVKCPMVERIIGAPLGSWIVTS